MEGRHARGPGKAVYELRTEYGNLKACELADRANVSRSALSRIESGEHTPSYDVLIRLLGVFRALPAELLIGHMMADIYALDDICPLTYREVSDELR